MEEVDHAPNVPESGVNNLNIYIYVYVCIYIYIYDTLFTLTLWSVFVEAPDNIFVYRTQYGYEFMQNRGESSQHPPAVMRQEITIFVHAADYIHNTTTYDRTKQFPQVSEDYKWSTLSIYDSSYNI